MERKISRRLALNVEEVRRAILDHLNSKDHPVPARYADVCITLGAYGAVVEWTDRSDWNPIRGCTRVSPGCGGPGPHGGCYAEAMAARFSDPGMWGHGYAERTSSGPRWTGKVELQEDRVTLPLKWRKPAKIFVSSTSDLFHEALPDEAIDKIFAVMALCPQHTFQVLTKRAERMRGYLSADNRQCDIEYQAGALANAKAVSWKQAERAAVAINDNWPLSNLWLGISCERQQEADERIPLLLQTPAAVRFISAEPLLGAIDLEDIDSGADRTVPRQHWTTVDDDDSPPAIRIDALGGYRHQRFGHFSMQCQRLDWVIVGGESGPHARPMHPDWARSIRDQCEAAGVPFFFKQWGEWRPVAPRSLNYERVGKKAAGRLLDGLEHNGFPVRSAG